MKTTFYSLILISLAVAFSFVCSIGCTVTEIRETYTDAKGHQVERVTTTKAGDPAAWSLAGKAMDVAAARAIRVREEKSGPITKEEIANRAKSIKFAANLSPAK